MKKAMILTAVFLFLGNYLFSQTWTVKQDESHDVEWRVLTGAEWHRLLEQKEAQYEYARLRFVDVLEIKHRTPINGTRPSFLDYYYLLGTIQPRTEALRRVMSILGQQNTILRYGNDKTGQFSIYFYNSSGAYLDDIDYIGSDSYNRRYNQYTRWVNGEY
jgi:hypothetical protein